MLSAANTAATTFANRTQPLPLSPSAQATLEKHLPGLPAKRLLHQQRVQKCDVACMTDLCSTEHLPEVEIFSLLEEQLPKYKIRADSMTSFAGYENQDFGIQFPALQIPTEGLGLTKEQTRECLNYFLLCGNRVSQMTRTYDDIQAVTRLLEEKEKDLELTVQIGKELLAQNNRLESRVAELEHELKAATENLAQLSHELHQKNELISILTNDVDDSGSENVTPTTSKNINLDILQRKISNLETENKSLKLEVAQVVLQTDEVEEQERKLMEDITHQLNSTNIQFDGLNLELERHKEENRLQHEQIVSLTDRLADAEIRLHKLTTENEEASSMLSITKENQSMLAGELAEFKARYQEVLNLLHETQEQLRQERKRTKPPVRSSLFPGLQTTTLNPESLQSELMETSMFSDNSLDSGIASDGGQKNRIPGYKKVFETVRYASNAASKSNTPIDGQSQLGSMAMSSAYQPRMSSFVMPDSNANSGTVGYKSGGSYYSTIYGANSMGGKSQSRESLTSDSDDNYPGKTQLGMPGCPGAKDLEAALKRLTPAEILARRAMLSHAPVGTYSYEDDSTVSGKTGLPLGLRTPDSIMSTGTGSSGLSGISSQNWRLPEKLQIVKPMEGSQTLHHWNRLATPTLSGLLDERPGVTIRGGRGLEELGLQIYSLSDLEEDAEEHPGKRFDTSGCVYTNTYTNSTVLHPDDGTSITFSIPPSQVSSKMHSECNSRQPSAPPTPRASLSRRNSCSTFSVHMGLASMLNERGIKAVTPSALNTPAGPNYSPTITPCNSPEGSPNRPRSPEPLTLSNLLSNGLKKITGGYDDHPMAASSPSTSTQRPSRMKNKALTHLERRALRQIRIMDKVESLGLENIIPTSSNTNISPLALHGTSAFIRRTASPMAQLTSLKHINEGRKRPEDAALRAAINNRLSDDAMSSTSSMSTTSSITPDSSSDISSSSVATNKKDLVTANRANRRPISEARMRQMQRQRSRRNLGSNGGAQRPDLGTVGNNSRPNVRPDLGAVSKGNPKEQKEEKPLGFVGTISSLLFGRKGGLL